MRGFKVLVCALVFAACGDDGGGGSDAGSNNGQVSEEVEGYCIATFTGEHDLLNLGGDVALHAEEGQRYLLTGLPDSPAIVYQHQDGAFDLELDVDTAPIDAPCLAEGAALTSEYVVFAQLDVAGERHGVHAFVVPIRTDGRPATGVRIEDDGLKMGLNGVANGKLWFHQERVPRAALPNRFPHGPDAGP